MGIAALLCELVPLVMQGAASYGALRLKPEPAQVVQGSGLTTDAIEQRQRSRKTFIALLASFTVLALLCGNHGHAPLTGEKQATSKPSNALQSHQQANQQQLEASAGGGQKMASLDELDKSGGYGVRLVASIEDAINTPPTKENSHYYSEHTDRIVHLTVILFLVLATVTVWCYCGRQ